MFFPKAGVLRDVDVVAALNQVYDARERETAAEIERRTKNNAPLVDEASGKPIVPFVRPAINDELRGLVVDVNIVSKAVYRDLLAALQSGASDTRVFLEAMRMSLKQTLAALRGIVDDEGNAIEGDSVDIAERAGIDFELYLVCMEAQKLSGEPLRRFGKPAP